MSALVRLALIAALTALVIFVPTASARQTDLVLSVVSQSATTITLGWTPEPEAIGYIFFVNGLWVSHTNNPSRSTVKFAKHDRDVFGVEALPGPTGAGFNYGEFTYHAPPPVSAANAWIDSDGGTCAYSATATPYSDGSACGSFDAAYDVVPDQTPATVNVRSGTYPAQTLSGTRTSGQVTFTPETAHAVTVAGNINLRSSDFATVDDMTIADGSFIASGLDGVDAPMNDTLQHSRINSGLAHNGFSVTLRGVQNMNIVGNTIGPTVSKTISCSPNCPSVEGIDIGKPSKTPARCGTTATQSCNVTIADNALRYVTRDCSYWPTSYGACPGVTCPNSAGCHIDAIHIYGIDGATITRNRLEGDECQGIFIENTNNNLNRDVTITNNLVSKLVGGCSNKGIYISASGTTDGATNGFAGAWTIAFNSGDSALLAANGCGSCWPSTTWDITGNHMILFNTNANGNSTTCDVSFGLSTPTYRNNLWRLGGSNHACNTSDALGNDTFVRPGDPPTPGIDMHLAGTLGPAQNIVPAAVCASVTAVDVDGNPRPQGTACEAGADESKPTRKPIYG